MAVRFPSQQLAPPELGEEESGRKKAAGRLYPQDLPSDKLRER